MLSKTFKDLSKVLQFKIRQVHTEYPFSKAIELAGENWSMFFDFFKNLIKINFNFINQIKISFLIYFLRTNMYG